jgi:hypothetical protein
MAALCSFIAALLFLALPSVATIASAQISTPNTLLAFGAYFEQPIVRTVTIKNNGGSAVAVSAVIKHGHFTIVGASTVNIAASASEALTLNFPSTSPLMREDTLILTAGAQSLEVSLLGAPYAWTTRDADYFFGTDFGEGDTTLVYLRNNSKKAIELSLSVQGNGFKLAGPQTVTLPSNWAEDIRVDWLSDIADPAEGTLTVFDGTNTVQLGLHASGAVVSSDSLILKDLDLGVIKSGDSICGTLSFKNRAHSSVTITEAILVGSPAFSVTTTHALPRTLMPNESIEWEVCMKGPIEFTSIDPAEFFLQLDMNGEQFTRSAVITGSWTYCFNVNHKGFFGPLKPGASQTDDVTIINPGTEVLTINEMVFSGSPHFSLLGSPPITVPAKDSAFIKVKWDAIGDVNQQGLLSLTSDCQSAKFRFRGFIATPLIGGQSTSLRFGGDTTYGRIGYFFYNDQIDPLNVIGVRLAQGVNFMIVNVLPTVPTQLASEKMIEVVLRWNGAASTPDTLIIETKDKLTSLRFPIDVSPRSAVLMSERPEPQLVVAPNPSNGPVNIILASGKIGSIEVLDILGNLIQRINAPEAQWDASVAPRGSYFIRVLGSDDAGEFLITRKIVLK